MKRIMASLFLLATSLSSIAEAKCGCHPEDYSFYIKAGSGVSFSESAHVSASPETWTPAIQGYNSTLGNRAIADFTLGIDYKHMINFEVSIADRSDFKYRKLQTPFDGDISYTREFDLDVTSILFSANLLGRDFECLTWNFLCGQIYPTIGAGVGISNLLITNFRTTGLPSTGASFPFESFSNENEYTKHRNFTYTLQLGLEYNYNDAWALSTGYRYFDAGKFRGPRYLRVSPGGSVDVSSEAWKMRFRANEWFITFSIFI